MGEDVIDEDEEGAEAHEVAEDKQSKWLDEPKEEPEIAEKAPSPHFCGYCGIPIETQFCPYCDQTVPKSSTPEDEGKSET